MSVNPEQDSLIRRFASAAVMQSVAAVEFCLSCDNRHPRIAGLLNETVLCGGKRLRPILLFMMGDLFGLPHEKVAFYSRAVEMIHASSLAHDDVIDEATERRGQPSINVVASNKRAILAGDYLLAQVLQQACGEGSPAIVAELARTIADLAEGEWLQIENGVREDLRYADVERVALHKTGSIMRLCSLIPAMLAGSSPEVSALAARFGEQLGLAFQLTDDILDLKRDDASRMQDLKSRTINSVIFDALSQAAHSDVIAAGRMIRTATSSDIDWDSGIKRSRQRLEVMTAALYDMLDALKQTMGEGKPSAQAYANIRHLAEFICHRV